jgi:UDP:flavonoid glycosyltransferase YjiC (YdhE family)
VVKVLLCPMSQGGYLYPALAIGRMLAAGGDQVTLLGPPSTTCHAVAAGLSYVAAERHDGRFGFNVSRWFLDSIAQTSNIMRVARELQPDAVVASALGPGALLAGELLDLPVFVIGFATHILNYRTSGQESPDRLAERQWRSSTLLDAYRKARERQGLPPRHDRVAESPLYGAGLLLRGCASLQCPGAELPAQVHQVGPCLWEPDTPVAELSEVTALLRRNGKRVVYVHLGRNFDGVSLWPMLNELFADSKFQAVVELGRSSDAHPDPEASITMVHKPWMQSLVALSDLVITGGTTSPVTAALWAARPLLLAPGGSEQLVLTDSCVQAGVGHRHSRSLDGRDERSLLTATGSSAFAERATALSAELRGMPGPRGAASLIRTVVSGRPSKTDVG